MKALPNYRKSALKAISVLQKSKCRTVPIDMNETGIIPENMRVGTYSDLAKLGDYSIEEVSSFIGSDSGACVRNGDNFILYVNDTDTNNGTIRFTCAHELGHFYLGHLDLPEDIKKSEYHVLEKEANCFARNLLAPYTLTRGICELEDDRELRILYVSAMFGISRLAAKTRLDFLDADMRVLSKTDAGFFNEFTYSIGVRCENCGQKTEHGIFCGNCGEKLDKYSLIMPECDEPDTCICKMCGCENERALVCKLCSYPLSSVCSDSKCARLNKTDAKYCIKCGAETFRG